MSVVVAALGRLVFRRLAVLFFFAASLSVDLSHAQVKEPLPASDPKNNGGWVLRKDISDEFEGSQIDKTKWFVEGDNGDYYIWKGRAPSQFAPHNVIVEDGKLKLRSRWEPDFSFATDEGHEGKTYRFHEGKDIPVTTAGVVSRKRFLNGYMEVKSKSGDAAMTSSFCDLGAAAIAIVNLGAQSYRKGEVYFVDPASRQIGTKDPGWAQSWEARSREGGPVAHIPGWKAGNTGSVLEEPGYMSLAGPWKDGVDPAG